MILRDEPENLPGQVLKSTWNLDFSFSTPHKVALISHGFHRSQM